MNTYINQNDAFTETRQPKAFFQPKLSVNTPGDIHEQEADAMANKVMRMKAPQKADAFFKPSISGIQRKCAGCDEEDKQVHRKENSGTETEGSNELDKYVSSLSSSGQRLPESSRQFFEPRFGQDFSHVKVHTDSVAAKSAKSINALAYTAGSNIVFNEGQYSPNSESGQKLMAHELTHVVQQNADTSPQRVNRLPEQPARGGADPCTYPGPADTTMEIHLNLALHAIRVYTGSPASPVVSREYTDIIIGPATSALATQNGWCHMYPIQGKQPISGNGLINFVNYCGNFGFHSNFWRRGSTNERIPGTQSHGCARLHDPGAGSNSESSDFFNRVHLGDCVRIYSQPTWRNPTFKHCRSDGDCTLT